MGPRLRFLAKLTGPPHLRLRFLRCRGGDGGGGVREWCDDVDVEWRREGRMMSM